MALALVLLFDSKLKRLGQILFFGESPSLGLDAKKTLEDPYFVSRSAISLSCAPFGFGTQNWLTAFRFIARVFWDKTSLMCESVFVILA